LWKIEARIHPIADGRGIFERGGVRLAVSRSMIQIGACCVGSTLAVGGAKNL
jgi:hypothetical protein